MATTLHGVFSLLCTCNWVFVTLTGAQEYLPVGPTITVAGRQFLTATL